MNIQKNLLAVVSLVAVSGCASSVPPGVSGAQIGFNNMPANPSPVLSRVSQVGVDITSGDDYGQTFRAYFAQSIEGATINDTARVTAGIVQIQIIDHNNIEVTTTKGNVIKYAYSYLGSIAGSANDEKYVYKQVGGSGKLVLTIDWTGLRYGFLTVPATGNTGAIQNDFVFGHLTGPGAMPISGTANYSGVASGYITEMNTFRQAEAIVGNSNLTADFSSGRLTGNIFDGSGPSFTRIQLKINAAISGNEFRDKNVAVSVFNGPNAIPFADTNNVAAAGEFIGIGYTTLVAGAFGGSISGRDYSSTSHTYSISGIFSAQ